MLISCSKDFFGWMSDIVRSIRFDAADYSVEQGSVKQEMIPGLHSTRWLEHLLANRLPFFLTTGGALLQRKPLKS
jgi:hypothetical protein